jgi:hypothetical protein
MISYPTSLDNLTNPLVSDALNSPSHAGQHSDANDAIEALQTKVGADSSAVGDSLDFKIQKKPTDLKISTASKGGVLRNIDGAVGGVAITADAFVEDEKFGVWGESITGGTSIEFDSAVTRTGRLTVKITTTNATGAACVQCGYNGITGATLNPARLAKYGIPLKPSTTYKITAPVKYAGLVSTSLLRFHPFDINGTRLTTSATTAESGTSDWVLRTLTFTTTSTAAYGIIFPAYTAAGDAQQVWVDWNSITFEEVVTNTTFTGKVAEKIRPVLQAVTSTDNIDQSLDPTGAYANTYALTTAVNEGATHLQTFTPTKKYITQIGAWVVAKGTGNWTLVVHNAANAVLASETIANASLTDGAFNYFTVPNIWASGDLHFHLYSSVADGTCKTNTSNDLETASYIQRYAKKAENFTLIANGIKTDLKADKDGLLSNAIIDLDNGKYRYRSVVVGATAGERCSDVYSFSGVNLMTLSTIGRYVLTNGTNIIFKVNTIFPIKLMKVSNQTGGVGGSETQTMAYSTDLINWIDLDTTLGVDKVLTGNISKLTGSVVYIRHSATVDTNYVITMNIEADLDTSSIPQGLFYPLGVNQFAETWQATGTVLSYVYRQATYTNEYGVVMPAIELNSGATGAGTALGYIPLKIDNSQETTPAITILTSSGVASDTVLDADGEYVALSSGATEGSIDYTVTITKNTLYLSSNAESVDSTQDPSHQGNFIIGVRQQGLTDRVKDIGEETADIKKGLADTKELVRNNALTIGFDAGTTDAYAIDLQDFTGYKTGLSVIFRANTANTDAATLNINGMGAKAIVKGVSTALSTNDILALMWCQCVYDGTNFVLLNPRAL